MLVSRLKANDAYAFDELFNRYSKKLYGFGLNYLHSEGEAEELVQEVFLRIWENRHALKTGYSFRSYLFTIALNQIRRLFNRRALSLRYLREVNMQEADDHTVESIDYASVLRRIDEIVESFPERKRQIFLKRRKEGKTSREIADELHISPATVDNQVSEALRLIRRTLTKEDLAGLLFCTLFF